MSRKRGHGQTETETESPMCLAILQPAGTDVPLTRLRQAAINNPDGCGYAYLTPSGVQTRKGRNWAEIEPAYLAAVRRYGSTSPFLVHFRWATHGSVSTRNTHPFRLADGGAMIHNGIIHNVDQPEGMSDTRYFVRAVIDRLPLGWQHDALYREMIARYIGSGNKLAFLGPDGSTLLINGAQGETYAGVWYSNDSYAPYLGAWWDEDEIAGYACEVSDDGYPDDPPDCCPECYEEYDGNALLLGYCPVCGVLIPRGAVSARTVKINDYRKGYKR